jgi:long-chain acyl-CoA synthetase
MDLPPLDRLDTLPKLLRHQAEVAPADVALREKDLGIWRTYVWRDCRAAVDRLAFGLAALGVRRGDVVAIAGRNRPTWLWAELATHALGAMSLGVYEDVLAPEAAYLLGYAGATVAVVEDEEQADKMLEAAAELPALRWIVVRDDRGMRKYDDPRLVSWAELHRRADALAAEEPGHVDREIAAGTGEEVAILCTTSGTTAAPKLAMLQHRPFLEHIAAYLRADPRGPTDEYVSILPLPWIMEQVYVVAMPLLSRIRVSFPESQETAMRDLREIGPTHVLLAPRVWEQTSADIRARVMDANPLTRGIVDLALRRGQRALDRGCKDRVAEALLFSTLRDRLGFSRLRSAATGGAALGPDTFRFFLAMGVPLRQLYGQTELSGAYTLQVGDALDFDSSGVPFDDTEIRIEHADESGVGEIVTRHHGMFKGYFRNEAATAETLTPDGWMRTGDAGYFDRDGRLVVIDRVKDIATTRSGVKFSPQFIENKLKFSPFIGECVVLGHRRSTLTTIVCIRYSMVAKWAEARRLAFTTYQNLAANPQVYELIAGEVEQVNATLPEAQRIRRFLLLHKELDPDDGELTRTRKVRRSVIDERYAPLIDALDEGRPGLRFEGEVTFEDGRRGRVTADLVIRGTAADAPVRRPAALAA